MTCHDVTLLRWAATSCGAGAALWRAGDWAQAAQLRGHKREVTQLAFSSCAGDAETETGDTETEAITCSYDRVILWSVAQLAARKVSRCQCTVKHHKRIRDFAWMQVEICRNTARISTPCPEIEFRKEKFDPRPPFCTPGVHSFSQRE